MLVIYKFQPRPDFTFNLCWTKASMLKLLSYNETDGGSPWSTLEQLLFYLYVLFFYPPNYISLSSDTRLAFGERRESYSSVETPAESTFPLSRVRPAGWGPPVPTLWSKWHRWEPLSPACPTDGNLVRAPAGAGRRQRGRERGRGTAPCASLSAMADDRAAH